MIKFFKFMIGIVLLPFCWSISKTVYYLLQSAPAGDSAGWTVWALPAGFLLWIVMFFVLPRPLRTYVLGHEVTHMIWGLLMGAKVGGMKVGTSGGHVELSKTNFLISLAPYFFPFYTGLVIALWYLGGLFWDLSAYEPGRQVLIGLTWGFHVTFTVVMLSQHQPDIQEHGRLFSYGVIYSTNLLFVAVWLVMAGSLTFMDFWRSICAETFWAYHIVWIHILKCVNRIRLWKENAPSWFQQEDVKM